MKRRLSMFVAAALLVAPLQLGAQSGNDLFQKALSKERAEGQLDAAIQLYEQVVREFATDRPLAAKALLQIGRCHERLGKDGAQKAYDRLVREYADQRTMADEARTRLAALVQAGTRRAGPAARQILSARMAGSVSPDGRYFSGTDWDTGDLATGDVASGQTRRLTHKGSWNDSSEFAEFSAISRDGKRIAYGWTSDDGSVDLRLIGMNGDRPRVLYRNLDVSGLQPFDWSPDGRQILTVFSRADGTNQLVLVPVGEGAVRVLKTFDWRLPWKAVFSPDGRYIVYDFPPNEDAPERDLFVIAADGSREVPLVAHHAHDFLLGWFPGTDRVLFASDRTGTAGAWAVQVESGRPRGDAELLKPSIGHVLPIGFNGAGDYYYSLSTARREVSVAPRDPATGKVEALTPLKGRLEEGKLAAVWSPNGEHLAYLLQSPLVRGGEGSNTLAVQTLATGQVRTSPLRMSYAQRLQWLPDGRALIVQGRDLKGRRGLFRVDISTPGFEPIVYGAIFRYSVAPDGRRLFYARGTVVVARDLQTDAEQDIYSLPENSGMALSPDGNWLALKINRPADSGRPSIQVVPVAGGEPRTIYTLPDPDSSSWRELAWSPDGRYLFFTKGHQEVWQIPVAGGAPQRVASSLSFVSCISIHPDGRRVAVSSGNAKYEVWVMETLLSMPSPPARTSTKLRGSVRR